MTEWEEQTIKDIAQDYFLQYPNEDVMLLERYDREKKQFYVVRIEKNSKFV